jgi:hypothetical protein
MDIELLESIFDKYEDEFGYFERVENKFSNRPDLHAFILLDKLLPGDTDIVCASEHDQFWLSVDIKELAKVIRLDNIVDLIRCGVIYDPYNEQFYMFD